MNDVVTAFLRGLLRLFLIAAGVLFFLSLLAAALVLALLWALRALWARMTGRPVAPWVLRVDPRAGWSQVYRRSGRWQPGHGAQPPQDERPAHLRPLPGAEDVTDVQPRETRNG